MIVQRTNTILYCRHWPATVCFYRDVLGLAVAQATEWFVEFLLTGDSFVSIADAARATVGDTQGRGLTLAWQVDDLERARDQLKAKGVATTPVQNKWGARVFYFNDPEGHRIEFWSPG